MCRMRMVIVWKFFSKSILRGCVFGFFFITLHDLDVLFWIVC